MKNSVCLLMLSLQLLIAAEPPTPGGQPQTQTVVPKLVSFNGVVRDVTGKPLAGNVSITFALYSQQQGGSPLWSEMQTVQADSEGNYKVFLGAASSAGLPLEAFTSGAARWLEVHPDVPGIGEMSRVLLVGVPYALKAADADTLGGKPASAFVTTDSTAPTLSPIPAATEVTPQTTPSGSGTTNYIPIWTNSTTLGNSTLYQSGSNVGIGTTTPNSLLTVNGLANIHSTYSDPSSSLTVGLGASPYNVTLFNPSTSGRRNAILFSGNSTHPTPYFVLGNDSTTAGSPDFFLYDKQASAFRLVVDASGNLGVGTTTPAAKLEVNGTAKFDGAVTFAGGITDTGNVTSTGQLVSSVATGTAPLQVTSSTQVANLNASYLGGQAASAFASLASSNSFSAINYFPGISSTTASTAIKGVATIDSDYASAIVGVAYGSSKVTIGVEGITSSPVGTGIYGGAGSTSNTGSTNGNGGYSGVWADTSLEGGSALTATTDDGIGGLLINASSTYPTLIIQALGQSPIANFESGSGNCTISNAGDLACTGSKSAVVPVDNKTRKVALYAVESPENWFEDFGSGHLINGQATVLLDATFAQTVNAEMSYHVFITPRGESKGLYVNNATAAAFEVREAAGGQSTIEFDYRIVARRKGYENVRLADKTDEFDRTKHPVHQKK